MGLWSSRRLAYVVNGVYYALNSKFEKAIFRNVRLTRDFKSLERLVDGTRKLVIPRRLFYEKLRTSRRVRTLRTLACFAYLHACFVSCNVLKSDVTYFRRTYHA